MVHFASDQLDVVSEYIYLKILFCCSVSFLHVKKYIADQARSAVIALLKAIVSCHM